MLIQGAVPPVPPPASASEILKSEVPEAKKGLPTIGVEPKASVPPSGYAEGGPTVLLALAVVALWRVIKKSMDESRELNLQLQKNQTEAIASLKESLTDVKIAVQVSDTNNQVALRSLGHVVRESVSRLDRHDEKLDAHAERLIHTEHRISHLERTDRPETRPGSL